MKFRVTMKTPIADALEDTIREEEIGGAVLEMCKEKWFEYGEYLTVEIDTEKGTCVVVER